MRSRSLAGGLATLAAVSLIATACGGSGSSASSSGVLKGASYTVGGKEFTEQKILCEMTAQLLEAKGATVKRQCGLSGTATVRTALTSGRIDMYWEYTGTGWITNLKHTKPIQDSKAQYEAVAKEDLAKNKIKWLLPAELNNTYGIGVSASKLTNVQTLSDYGKLAQSNPSQAKMCVATEFLNRDDGLPGLEKTYGFKLSSGDLATLDEGAIYNAISKAKPCNFGEIFTTDGRIKGLKLRVLTDDKKFFPLYNASLNIRQAAYEKNTKIASVIGPLTKVLTTATMQQLNADVDVNGDQPADVAKKFLSDKGLVK